MNGAGTVSTRVTNALGDQVTTDLPFYTSLSLLAEGLQAYSAQVRAVRRYWGTRSNDYGQLAATGTYRRGLSPRLTFEMAGEATDGLVMGGAGVLLNVANLAMVNVAGAASRFRGALGAQVAAGIQHVDPVFTFAVSGIFAGGEYRDVAATQGDAAPRRQLRASAGVSLRRFGSLGVAFADLDRALDRKFTDVVSPTRPRFVDPLSLAPSAFLPVDHARLLSGSYSTQCRLVSLQLTGFQDFARRGARGLSLSAAMPLGRRDAASVGTTAGPQGSRAQVQANRTPMAIGDWGYQVAGQSGAGGNGFGQVEYRSEVAQFSAGVERTAGRSSARIGARGSVSVLGGDAFLSNKIPDSFAVVDTGVPNIGVLVENRPVGRTDAHGRLLVPDLRSFDVNRLSIDPLDAPPDARVETVEKVVRPFDRSGVVVRFPLVPSHGALVHLVDASGKVLPLGTMVTLSSTGAVAPVGYDGAAYLEDLRDANVLLVERPDASQCVIRFAFRPTRDGVPDIGPLPCQSDGE
ncbi:fimbria/pilus outer membrane usher protein [Sphingomonas sp.]|uniref:fimbria/pilus outer membrane usher protein n=1 Tax=Sphingomonas sp. TaxID=28214 RepID=UPI003B005635